MRRRVGKNLYQFAIGNSLFLHTLLNAAVAAADAAVDAATTTLPTHPSHFGSVKGDYTGLGSSLPYVPILHFAC